MGQACSKNEPPRGAAKNQPAAKGTPAAAAKKAAVATKQGGPLSLAIFYGSQTGTAENYAKMLSTTAISHGFIPHICTMNDAVNYLRNMSTRPTATVWITSTYGSGEFPDSGLQMNEAFNKGLLDSTLKGLQFAVFGLGNRKNEHFNAAAKKVHDHLSKVGAIEVVTPQYSCELDGHDIAFRSFKQSLWAALGSKSNAGADTSVYTLETVTTGAEALPSDGFEKAQIRNNNRSTPEGYAYVTCMIEATIPSDAQKRQLNRSLLVNDWVDVLPQNSRAVVDRAVKRLKVAGTTTYRVTPKPGAAPSKVDNRALTVDTLLTEVIDLTAIPSRSFLEALTVVASGSEKTLLDELANDLSLSSKFEKFAAGVFGLIDLLEMVPNTPVTIAMLLTHAPRIVARTYSIACSLKNAHPNHPINQDVQLLYRVPTRTADSRTHEGLCSSYMRDLKAGDNMLFKIRSSGLPVITDDIPVCYIALSSGVGSVRALMQQRFRNLNAAPCRLYYSFRNKGQDQLFVDEFQELVSKDLLQLVNCASHDTEKPKYLVDYLTRDIPTFLGAKGVVHYCGAGGSVPSTIDYGLRRCGVDVSKLRAEGRYIEEFFTPDHDVENLLKCHDGGKDDGATLATRMGAPAMFCFQCEQTRNGKGCTKVGVCGKTAEVSWLQDLTIHAVKRLGFYLHHLRLLGAPENVKGNHMTLQACFTTLTNVNFDEARFQKLVEEVRVLTDAVKVQYEAVCKEKGETPLECPGFKIDAVQDIESLVEKGKAVGVLTRFTDPETQNAAGVSEMLMYGLKGIAAYSDHALMNKMEDSAIYTFMHEALAALCDPTKVSLDQALKLCLEAGKCNVTTMALLYKSHTTLGVPTPTSVPVAPVPGKCILVSGHDLIILKQLLVETEPLGINVYTHGEMLPAHGYPELHKHKNLVANFGGAWMRQSVEFPHFPGAILMTTNCLTSPGVSYKDRLFTAGAVGWKGLNHIGNTMDDIKFGPLIECAKKLKGFTTETSFTYADQIGTKRPKELMVGFGHETIIGAAGTIVEQIQKGNITRFFLVGGCDGYEGERSYYTELVKNLPKTCVILTVGCGKYRINHLDLGTIGDTGLPRLLDLGQCNDSFSAVQVAIALAGVLKCEIKDLPLSIVLSWFEQKAIAVLLSCLSLGLKPIHVGPSLPAFLTPDVLGVLVKDFGIRVLGDPLKDMEEMLAAPGAS